MANFESPAEGLPGPRIQKTTPFFETVESRSSVPSVPPREGLPASYRMRADPHYVDLLGSRASSGRERMLAVHSIEAPAVADPTAIAALVESVRRFGMLQPLLVQERDGTHRLISGRKRLAAAVAAGLREVPCVVFDVSDEEAARLDEAANVTARTASPPRQAESSGSVLHGGNDLAQSLSTLGACADLLTGSPSELSRTVIGNLIRAEVWRASCLLHAVRTVRQELPVTRTAVSVLGILSRIEQGFLPERQVRAIVFDSRSDVPHGSLIAADERMLTGALSSAVLATLPLLDGIRDARLTIAATLSPAGGVTFTVSQEFVAPTDAWSARAFDQQWVERPGGTAAAIALLAVRRTAEVHGGTATADVTPRGTRITLAIPTGL